MNFSEVHSGKIMFGSRIITSRNTSKSRNGSYKWGTKNWIISQYRFKTEHTNKVAILETYWRHNEVKQTEDQCESKWQPPLTSKIGHKITFRLEDFSDFTRHGNIMTKPRRQETRNQWRMTLDCSFKIGSSSNRQVTNNLDQMLGRENYQEDSRQRLWRRDGLEGSQRRGKLFCSDGKFRIKAEVQTSSELSQRVWKMFQGWARWSKVRFQMVRWWVSETSQWSDSDSDSALSQNGQIVAFQWSDGFSSKVGQWCCWVRKPLCELEKPESLISIKTFWKLTCNTLKFLSINLQEVVPL